MGDIVSSKNAGDKVLYKVELSLEEAKQLKNHVKSVHLFSEDLTNINTTIIQRGNKGGAKYFKIPLELKSRKKRKLNDVSYQKIETNSKVFYINVVKKDLLFNSNN